MSPLKKAGQMSFDWRAEPSYASEDFVIALPNEQAFTFLSGWPRPDAPSVALLSGDAGSGKTHLALTWQARTGARLIDASALGSASSDVVFRNAHAALLENIHALRQETALFHLLRHAESHGLHLLLTSRLPAQRMTVGLPDLRSRLLAASDIRIAPPDDTLLAAFAAKRLADHQLRVAPETIAYLVRHAERSLASMDALLHQLAVEASAGRREITIPFIVKTMNNND